MNSDFSDDVTPSAGQT